MEAISGMGAINGVETNRGMEAISGIEANKGVGAISRNGIALPLNGGGTISAVLPAADK